MNFVPDPNWIELFPISDIPIIIQDVLDTTPHLKSPPDGEKRPEEYVSRQVYDHLRRNKWYYTGPLTPSIEHWLPNLDSRTDIIFFCAKGQETYFVVEAKRLFVTFPAGKKVDLIKDYIDKGMMRFIESRYAPYQQASAMIGYVFNDSCATARRVVKIAIEKQRTKTYLTGDYGVSVLPVKPPVDETHHDVAGKPFTLYHLFIKLNPCYATI